MFETVESFLKHADLFKLGELPTERRNPLTRELSEWANRDLDRGLSEVHAVDARALETLRARFETLEPLHRSVRETLSAGGRVYLCGCGATGRLSLSLEAFWREAETGGEWRDRVIALMAGGDAALVKSVEHFEDHPEFGERHLRELGFGSGDLLIASTEGGETPYVIGAAQAAARDSKRKPFFLFCNPSDELCRRVERSREVLENPRVHPIELALEPMALSGSTRLQASTVLMLAVGLCLLEPGTDFIYAKSRLEDFLEAHRTADYGFLVPFIQEEARIYQAGDALLYETLDYGMTVLTDTTERSPTFSLRAFENAQDSDARWAWSFLHVPGTLSSQEAWEKILKREPRGLEWEGFEARLGAFRIHGFDFSDRGLSERVARVSPKAQHAFRIDRSGENIRFRLNGLDALFPTARLFQRQDPKRGISLLFEQTQLKLLLNLHSLFVMGRMRRYESNLMTYVRPSNGKLVDRSIRYIRALCESRGWKVPDYETAARLLFEVWFELRAGLSEDEPIVLRSLERWHATGKAR